MASVARVRLGHEVFPSRRGMQINSNNGEWSKTYIECNPENYTEITLIVQQNLLCSGVRDSHAQIHTLISIVTCWLAINYTYICTHLHCKC